MASNYYKFNSKSEAVTFVSSVNSGEGYVVSEQNVTTGYCQPIEYYGTFYVIADSITGKYTTDTPVSLDTSPPNTVQPQSYGYGVIIPEIYHLPFVYNNWKFILNGFEVPLQLIGNDRVVDLCYFIWPEFRAELDRKDGFGNFVHKELKESLMPLWDYVQLQIDNNNLIQL